MTDREGRTPERWERWGGEICFVLKVVCYDDGEAHHPSPILRALHRD